MCHSPFYLGSQRDHFPASRGANRPRPSSGHTSQVTGVASQPRPPRPRKLGLGQLPGLQGRQPRGCVTRGPDREAASVPASQSLSTVLPRKPSVQRCTEVAVGSTKSSRGMTKMSCVENKFSKQNSKKNKKIKKRPKRGILILTLKDHLLIRCDVAFNG